MKPKKFKDALWPFFLIVELFFVAITIPMNWGLVVHFRHVSYPFKELLLYSLFSGLLTIAVFWMATWDLWFPRAFGRLLVYENRIVYKCLFRRTRTLTFEECNYIGIEDYSKLKRGMPVVRGDEISFIYFSTKPYPEKYKGKISLLKNTEDFIKIGYSDALAKALIDILPADKDYLIRSFYGKMQASDRRLGKNKKK